MSVKIDNMSGSIFTATPSGITRGTTDNSTYAATTNFVKNFASLYLFILATPQTMSLPTLTFSSIYTTLVGFISPQILRGAISIGKATTIIKFFNNTIPVDINYPYVLSSDNTNSQRIQAGYITASSTITAVSTPYVPAGTSNAFATPSIQILCGVQTTNATGFNVRLNAAVSNEVHWILFQTN